MYIKREAIRQEVEHSMHDNPHTDGIVRRTHNHEHQHFLRLIEDAPAADVAPIVHGKWLDRRRKNGVGKVCSACMEAFNFAPTPFCPACGATMDLEDDA